MKRTTLPCAAALFVALAAAAPCQSRVLPETLVLPQCEFYPLREQDRGYLYRYVDQPLFVDPDLPEDAPCKEFQTRRHRFWGEWYSQADWNRAQEIGRDSGFDGFAFFPRPHRARYWDAMEKSPVSDFLSVPIAHNRDSDGKDFMQWFGNAACSTKAYRHGGKALILSYRFASRGSPEELKAKLDRARGKFGDKFAFVCDVSRILHTDEAMEKGRLSDATVAASKELIRGYLRVCDGVMIGDAFSVMRFDGCSCDRVFFSSHYEQLAAILKETVEEPEFRGKKLFGLAAVIAHENHTVQFWTASEDGLMTLTESLRIACAAEPDVILLPEWDELNENSCVCPTVANGFSVKRVLRYFKAGLRKAPLAPLPGDDTSVPNLIVSCRRSVSPGERMIVDVLNVPDGSRSGRIDVALELLVDDGGVAVSFPAQRADEAELVHLRFPVDSAALAERTRTARMRVSWRAGGNGGVFEDGLFPIDLLPASGCWRKEIHQPVRDLVPMEAPAKVEFVGGRMKACIKSRTPIRYAFVCGNGQIQHIEGNPASACARFREDADHAVFAISGTSPAMLDMKKFQYRVAGASSAEWLDRMGAHSGTAFDTDWLSDSGDPYYLRIPRADVAGAALEIDFGKAFQGRVPLRAAFEGGAYALEGERGVQFSVTRFRRQSRYPSAANSRVVSFDVPVDGDRPSMSYHVVVVAMDGRTWRSRPFVAEATSGELAAMCVRSALSGGLRDIRLPAPRVPCIEYDLAAETGTFLPTKDHLLHFATVLGGCYSMATLWNRCSSASNDMPIGTKPDWRSVVSAAPKRVREADGSLSLSFDGVDDFVAFPWETVPQNSAYSVSFEIMAEDVAGRMALFASKRVLNAHISGGVLNVAAGGASVASPAKLEKGVWHKVEIVHSGDALAVSVDGRVASRPAKLAPPFMSSLMLGLPMKGSGMAPFRGRVRGLRFCHRRAEF